MSEDRREESALEDYLERRSGLSKAYRDASAEQPPAALDEAILAASRRAVGAGPRRVAWPRRWGAPLAAAAVLVLAVAVALNLEEEPRIAQFKESEAPAPLPQAASPEAGSRVGQPDAGDFSRAKREAKTEPQPGQAKKSSALAAPAPSTGKVLADKAPAPAQPRARVPAQPPKAQAPGELTEERASAAGLAAKPPEARAEAAASDELAGSRRDLERATANDSLSKQSAASVSPEKLVRQIEALYAQGNPEEGDRALREFCRSFPAHALPEALSRRALRLGLGCKLRE